MMGMHFYMVQELFTEISALLERYDVNLSNNSLMWLKEAMLNMRQYWPAVSTTYSMWGGLNFSRALVSFAEVNH